MKILVLISKRIEHINSLLIVFATQKYLLEAVFNVDLANSGIDQQDQQEWLKPHVRIVIPPR
ncbi:MAG: hypothetical protein ACK514_05450 [Bacteroidota bacterium]|nr:hypothetical protein [Cytophagales bacterium]